MDWSREPLNMGWSCIWSDHEIVVRPPGEHLRADHGQAWQVVIKSTQRIGEGRIIHASRLARAWKAVMRYLYDHDEHLVPTLRESSLLAHASAYPVEPVDRLALTYIDSEPLEGAHHVPG